MDTLSGASFEKLLYCLDPTGADAGSRYEDLRLKIEKFVTWQGCPGAHAERLTDTTIDRIAAKIDSGENIENINAYAVAVARFVWLEFNRKHKEDATDDLSGNAAVLPDDPEDDEDERLACLRRCLIELGLTDEDRRLIVAYYDTDSGDKIKQARKRLAESIGSELNALRVRMFRVRARLEDCINTCTARVMKRTANDTIDQEALRR